jgi:hypothetical protein
MNARHSAAVALVGWYLLVPPVQTDLGIVQIQADAPLSKWSIHRGTIRRGSAKKPAKRLKRMGKLSYRRVKANNGEIGAIYWF